MLLAARWRSSFGFAAAAGFILAAIVLTARPAEDLFMAENRIAVSLMMAGMNIPPSGEVDRDFVAMMIPHHQGAIDMAKAELRHGRNEQLRRIAQEIIVDQEQEIAAMRLALVDGSPAPAAARGEPADSGSSSRAWAYFLSANICSERPK